MENFTRYLKILLGVVVAAIIVVASTNILVDPFALFAVPEVAGLNQRKTETFKHIRLMKAYEIRRVKADAVILGNSRIEMALDPTHPAFRALSQTPYNAALSGGTLYEVLRYLQHADAQQPIKAAVLGLDKAMFELKAQDDFDETILAVSRDGATNHYPFAQLIRTAMSLDTFDASQRTVERQSVATAIEYRADGMRRPESADNAVGVEGGARAAFRNKMDKFGGKGGDRKKIDEREHAYENFRQLLKYCRTRHIDMHIFIHPLHAWTEENFAALGEGESLVQWKRKLVEIIEDEVGADKTSFPLWDFSGYNTVTTEAVPLDGDRVARMKYYWEPLHYTKLTGDLILDRMFGTQDSSRTMPADFGVLLNSDNFDRVNAQNQKAREQFRKLFVADIAEIESVMRRGAR